MSISRLSAFRRLRRTAYIGAGAFALATGSAYAQTAPASNLNQPPPPPANNAQVIGNETWMYDTNPLRLLQDAKKIEGFVTSGTLLLNLATPTTQLTTSSEVDNNAFDNAKFNSNNFHEKASLFKRNERWTAGINGVYDYDTTRTSEITTFGINIPSVRHIGASATPEIDFTPNAVEKLQIIGTASRSTYDNTAFTNYTFDSFYPTYSYAFDPLDTGILTMNFQRYATTNNIRTTIDTEGPSVGWKRIIDPNTAVKITAGAEESSQTATSTSPSTSRLNYVFSGNLNMKEESDAYAFNASRNQQPFGNGSAALFTTLQASDVHAINNNLSANVAATYRYAQYLNATGTNLNREIDGSAGLTYHWFQDIDLTGSYQYAHQTLTNTSGSVRDQVIMLGITYHPLAKDL